MTSLGANPAATSTSPRASARFERVPRRVGAEHDLVERRAGRVGRSTLMRTSSSVRAATCQTKLAGRDGVPRRPLRERRAAAASAARRAPVRSCTCDGAGVDARRRVEAVEPMPAAYGQCSSRARSSDDTTSAAVTGWPSDHVAGPQRVDEPAAVGRRGPRIGDAGHRRRAVSARTSVSVGYWSFHTSRATALVAVRGSSEPIGPMTPTVSAPDSRPIGATGARQQDRAATRARADRDGARVYARRHRRRRRSRRIWRDGVQPGDAGDAAAAVRRAARLVQPGDRRAEVGVARAPAACGTAGRARARRGRCCRRPARTRAPSRTGPITCRCRIESVNPGATASTRAMHAIGVRVELVGVRLRRPLVRHPLREHRHDVLALGRERVVEHRRDADVGERQRRGAAGDRVLERALDVVERLGEHDRAAVHLGIEAGLGAELGQPVDGDVDLHGAAARLPLRRSRRRSRRAAPRASIWSRNVIFGCVAAITTSARSSSPDSSTTPRARPSRTSMRATARVGADRRAERLAPRRAARRVTPPMPPRGKPHVPSSPSPTSPILWCAITYAVPAERGPGPRADDAAHRQHAPHLRRLEPVVEQVGDARS